MIHHISISAINPQRVAQALAKVMKGQIAPFPPHPGSYFVFPGDEHGTAIEVYPLGSEIVPGAADEQCMFVHNANASMSQLPMQQFLYLSAKQKLNKLV